MEEKITNEVKIKRLAIDLPADYHQEIKIRAAQRNITIRTWVLRALKDKIKAESIYE